MSLPARGSVPRVCCWDDLWRWVHARDARAPLWLSEAACRAVLREATTQLEHAGALAAIEHVVHWPGYRRALRRKFRDWTSAELPLSVAAPRPGRSDPVELAEWSLFVRYRTLLDRLKAEDDAGMEAWASRHCGATRGGAAPFAAARRVVFLNFEGATRAWWRVLEHALRCEAAVDVTLTFDAARAGSELYLAAGWTRERLLKLGLTETAAAPRRSRPAGLLAVEEALFQDTPDERSRIAAAEGLAIRGGPHGEGVARLIAAEVHALRGSGVPPEEILVLFDRWDEQAELAAETLRGWGIPAHADVPGTLRRVPAASLLTLAARLPIHEWETDHILRLLRNGLFRPAWSDGDVCMPAAAAAAIRATGEPVFRGRQPLLTALERAQSQAGSPEEAERFGQARDLLSRLFGLLEPLTLPRPWSGHLAQLQGLARELGLLDSSEAPLDPLWSALEDHEEALRRLGRGDEPLRWEEFIDELEDILSETTVAPIGPDERAIRMTTVERCAGAGASHVLLAGLEEGVFPSRQAVEPFLRLRPGAVPEASSLAGYGREMLRFLEVVGSAEAGATLLYPTTDAKGQALLRSAFLEDLIERLTPEAAAACHAAAPRFHPALVDRADLAGSAADARVRAAALAIERGDLSELSRLAGDPLHRPSLEELASSLIVLRQRARGTPFSAYEGRLDDPAARAAVGAAFGSGFTFSASQLETYIQCPFLFFSRYVLNLKPLTEAEELDEDYTEMGSRVHDILEKLESLLQAHGAEANLEALCQAAIEQALDVEDTDIGESELQQGLKVIERRRIERYLALYCRQRGDYEQTYGPSAGSPRLEVGFGVEGSPYPALEIGAVPDAVRLRGRIDRVDLVQSDGGPRFRVIDYKTGKVPATADVRRGDMLQLVLYAMAVERHVLAGSAAPAGAGYWELRDAGFKEISFPDWGLLQEQIHDHVKEAVERLRSGRFEVDPRKDGCESYCDFRSICRIRQVRLSGKCTEHEDRQLAVQSTRRRRPRAGGTADEAPARPRRSRPDP